jgi:zinc D-Ala-D-Ala carboxypeptidase
MDTAAAPAGHTPNVHAGIETAGRGGERLFLLTTHFTREEFTFSQTAERLGIDNSLPEHLVDDARKTCAMLERIREYLSDLKGAPVPVLLSSGYRCLKLNRTLGSDDSSDHVIAHAADFRAPAFGTPFQVATTLAPHAAALGIGQLIHEFGRWVHVGRRVPLEAINRVITIDAHGTRAGILPARTR